MHLKNNGIRSTVRQQGILDLQVRGYQPSGRFSADGDLDAVVFATFVQL